MQALFIINPIAGGANRTKKITDSVRDVLGAEEGIFEIRAAKARGDAGELAAEAVKRGYDAVIACGGDGTVNEVASRLVGTPTVLGVVPCGTGNGFARALGIPRGFDAAMKVIKNRAVREIDAGVICGRYFFATSGAGFDAHLSKVYNEHKLISKVRGVAPYVPLSMMEFYKYRPVETVIKIDDDYARLKPFILTFANTDRYASKFVIAPGAEPDDGFLDVCMVPHTGLKDALVLAARLFKGNISGARGYRRVKAARVEIACDTTTLLHADGEPFEHTGTVTVETLHKKLRVLV